MRLIRQQGTSSELLMRRWLWNRGVRFTTRNRDLPGSPDLANRSRRWALFVHGCFWHGHQGCVRSRLPKRNADFWREKIAGNRERDCRKEAALRALGYRVFVVWGCEADKLTVRSGMLATLAPLVDRPPTSRED
jgi:DNA mismatch endonuclease (patch repair protein)